MAASARQPTALWALFGFDGRINREVFWLGNLLLLALTMMLAMVAPFIIVGPTEADIRPGHPISLVGLLGLMWMQIALTVKRLHDRGVTGWAALVLLIPVVSIAAFFFIGLMPSQPGANLFGPASNSRGR